MIPDIDIWRAAILLVRRHGSTAPAEAEERAGEMIEDDDVNGWAVWTRIAKAAEELLREKPRTNERVN